MYIKSFNDELKLTSKNLQRIIDFYLIKCPVKETSKRGISFEQYGIEKGKYQTLKAAMLSSASESLKKNYFPCKKSELNDKFNQVEKVKPIDEYCVFLQTGERRVMDSLFAAIRNALAHGSFNIRTYKKTKVYFFANYHQYLKAEIVLREKTLLEWIKIIENFKEEHK